MLDDLDTTGVTILMYLVIAIFGFMGAWIFIKRKNIVGTIFWVSSVLNFSAFVYFMGNYRLYPKFFYPIINSYWPWINLGLFILLIANYIRNKRSKPVVN